MSSQADAKTFWTAVGSLAAVASALIAFLSYRAHDAGTAAAGGTPKATAVAWDDLTQPCQAPSASVVFQFNLQPGHPFENIGLKSCYWVTQPPGWDQNTNLNLFYERHPYPAAKNAIWKKVSLIGLPSTIEHADNTDGGCEVDWDTSFGSIAV